MIRVLVKLSLFADPDLQEHAKRRQDYRENDV